MVRLFAAGFVAGAVALHTAATLPAPDVAVASACAAGLVAALVMHRLRRELAAVAIVAVGVQAGFACALLRADARLGHRLDPELDEQTFEVRGIVRGLPHAIEARGGSGLRFDLEIESIDDRALARPMLVAASWYPPQRKGEADSPPPVEPGQRWAMALRLRAPHGSMNPAGFDYEAWLFERDVVATAVLRDGGRRLDGQDDRSLESIVDHARFTLERTLAAALDGRPRSGVILALVVGDQSAIAQDDWTLFNRAGISHLVAISGLHITMLAAIGAWLCTRAWHLGARIGWIGERAVSAPACAAIAGLGVAVAYTALAGFGVPAQRTLAMLAVVALARLTATDARPFHVLSLALIAVVALDPWAVRAPGFWLSFAAVGCLMLADRPAPDLVERGGRIGRLAFEGARAQLAVTIGLVPVTLLAFQQVSLVGPLANAVAIPLVSYVVTPLALAGAATGSGPLLQASAAVFAMLADWLAWLVALPHASLAWPAPEPWTVVLATLGLAWVASPRALPARLAGLACCVPLLLPVQPHPAAGSFVATILDVGQGSAVLVETARHRLLYDTGPRYAQGSDAAQHVLLPLLQARGIASLDVVVLSHDDSDHSGGMRSLLAQVGVERLLADETFAPLMAAGTRREDCRAGQAWTWDGVTFRIIAPTDAYANARKANARSCVLRVATGTESLLLTGDIEAAQERELVRAQPESLQATVVTMPHHGSTTSSSAGFVDAIGARLVVAQTGWRNAFGHPRDDVVARYEAADARVLRTDDVGAIELRASLQATTVRCWRAVARRYWHAAASRDCLTPPAGDTRSRLSRRP